MCELQGPSGPTWFILASPHPLASLRPDLHWTPTAPLPCPQSPYTHGLSLLSKLLLLAFLL